LIRFAEESVFARINQILAEEKETRARCAKVLYLLLGFAARNPGITRVLLGDALVGETERLLSRVENFFARIETQLRQIIRESALRESQTSVVSAESAANLMLAVVEGRMHQFLRSRFQVSPLQGWQDQWAVLEAGLFKACP
jgi:TetR/AcrR family transcriptional regulator